MFKTLIFLGLGLLVGITGWMLFKKDQTQKEMLYAYVEASSTPLPSETAAPTTTPLNQPQLKKIFDGVAAEYPKIEISASIKVLNQNSQFEYNPERVNIGASTTKLFTASAFLETVEKGTHNFEEKMGNYDAKFQFEQLINRSNNISWSLFYDLLGRKNIEEHAHKSGAPSFSIKDNTLKAADMSTFLANLYQNKLHTQEHTDYLLSLMQNTEDDSFLPNAPSGYTLRHKNGKLEGVVNEAVIARKDQNVVLIAIYTDGNGVWEYNDRKVLFNNLLKNIIAEINYAE